MKEKEVGDKEVNKRKGRNVNHKAVWITFGRCETKVSLGVNVGWPRVLVTQLERQ